jgi:peptidoglycan/LPS O-acetylase OafA/YrhL
MTKPHTLSPACSFLLDLVRFSAAILVVIAHLGHPEFRTALPNRQILGDIAVPIFFVLSGFVIRFVTQSREHTLRLYFIDRASRMYSVILPAMALTLILSAICLRLDRPYYLQFWGALSDHIPARVLLNLTFLSQSWGRTAIPLIDSPFWSLSYECLFYIAYGLFFYLRGWKRILTLVLWALIAGPQVVFLLPVWALGCGIYDLYHHLRRTPAAQAILIATAACLFAATVLFLSGRHTLLEAPLRLHQVLIAIPNPLLQIHMPIGRATMMAVATGTFAAASLLLLTLLADQIPLPHKSAIATRFRPIADSTFAIYLMHYPLLVLAGTIGLLHPHNTLLNVASASIIVLLLIPTAAAFDSFKNALRRWLTGIIPTHRQSPVPAAHFVAKPITAASHPRASTRSG